MREESRRAARGGTRERVTVKRNTARPDRDVSSIPDSRTMPGSHRDWRCWMTHRPTRVFELCVPHTRARSEAAASVVAHAPARFRSSRARLGPRHRAMPASGPGLASGWSGGGSAANASISAEDADSFAADEVEAARIMFDAFRATKGPDGERIDTARWSAETEARVEVRANAREAPTRAPHDSSGLGAQRAPGSRSFGRRSVAPTPPPHALASPIPLRSRFAQPRPSPSPSRRKSSPPPAAAPPLTAPTPAARPCSSSRSAISTSSRSAASSTSSNPATRPTPARSSRRSRTSSATYATTGASSA